MQVREATDLAGVARLFAQMYSVPVEQAHSRLAAMQAGKWNVTEGVDDQGAVAFALWVDLDEYLFLRSYAVDAERRVGGLGRVFFERLRAEIFPQGKTIRLEVANDGPHGFWAKMGFAQVTTGMWLEAEAA